MSEEQTTHEAIEELRNAVRELFEEIAKTLYIDKLCDWLEGLFDD